MNTATTTVVSAATFAFYSSSGTRRRRRYNKVNSGVRLLLFRSNFNDTTRKRKEQTNTLTGPGRPLGRSDAARSNSAGSRPPLPIPGGNGWPVG